MTLLTIITVVRNDRDGLRRTAESLAGQTLRDFEWRVIDAASTDGTAELAERMKERMPSATVISERDRGLYDGMNKGLRAAEGEFVMFLNAGDEFAGPLVLEAIAEALAPGDVDILWGSSYLGFGSKRMLRRVKDPDYIWHGQPGLHQATVYRASLHRQHEYDQDFGITGDYECLCRMVMAGARTRSRDMLISINELTRDSASNKSKLMMTRECFKVQRDILRLPLHSRVASATRRLVNSIGAKSMVWALDRGPR